MQDAHFLRPALTKHIIQRLQRGESLNLFGKPFTSYASSQFSDQQIS